MTRRRNSLWGGLAAVGIAAAFIAGIHYAPGLSTVGSRYAEAVQSEYPEFRHSTGSSTVSTSSSAVDSLRRAGLVDGGRRRVRPDEAGQVGQVAGDQRHHARRREAHRARQHGHGDRREQRAAYREGGRGVHR